MLSGVQNQTPIILKLSFEHADLICETRSLEAFSSYGGVRVLEYAQNALLLQRAVPGKLVKELKPACWPILCLIQPIYYCLLIQY